MVPTALVIMASLPLTANGKLDRRALPIPESTQANRKRPLVLPRTDLEKQLVSIWEATLKTRPIGIEDDFFALGGHSLLAVQLFAQIEKETGVNLPLATLFREATISHLAQLIAVEQPAGKNTWESLVTIQPQGSETPFFCIHGITGDILWFKELGRLFAPERPFIGLQSRGLDGVQTVLTDLPSMASYYIDAIKQKQPHGPYLIGGASFGGTVSLEMARQLQARGDEVALLVIFDHAPPNVLASHSTLAKAPEIASNFPRWLQGFVQLGPTRMWRRVLRKLRTLNSPPPSPYNPQKELTRIEAANIIDYAHELPEHRRRLIEVNFQAIDSYQPQPYNGRVLFIKARSRSLFSQTDPVMVWQQLVSPENLTVAEVPGTHESIFTQPNVATLGVILKQALHKASNTDL
jgi:thioesterase domain-containing protein/acyl carrier protein